jgi:hypothetical protein
MRVHSVSLRVQAVQQVLPLLQVLIAIVNTLRCYYTGQARLRTELARERRLLTARHQKFS